MKIQASELRELYKLLSERTDEPIDFKGLESISNKIGGSISQKYLYEKLREVNVDKKEEVSINNAKLDVLLGYLGFDSYKDFRYHQANPILEELKSCEGNWINYVRQNSAKGYVLASPVKISQERQRMVYLLKGPDYNYQGNVNLRNGCLFCSFSNENGKQFHHVYKIGSRRSPDVLQGVFSGISTSNEPIAGRTILVRNVHDFEKITNCKYTITELMASENDTSQAIGTYFNKYSDNNLALNRVITYGLEDLLS